MAHRFTARPVVIAGAILSSLGAMLCFFANNIQFLTVTLGIVHAIGSGMIFVVTPTFINEHFVKHKRLAMGINFTGVTMATFVFPKLIEYCTTTFGLQGALLIFGAVVLNALAFGLFLRAPLWIVTTRPGSAEGSNQNRGPELLQEAKSRTEQKANVGTFRYGLTVFTYPIFYLTMYSFIVYSFGFECYISLFVDFAVDRGVAKPSAVTIISLSAIADVAGRLTLPAAADKGLLTNKALMIICLTSFGALFVVLPYVHSYGLLFAFAFGLAYFVGTGLVLFPLLLAEYLGIQRVSMSYGMVIASAGIFSFIKPSVIGYFRDDIGAYDTLFTICGAAILFGAFMWMAVVVVEGKGRTREINLEPLSREGSLKPTKMTKDDNLDF